MVIILPEGGTEQGGAAAGDVFDLITAGIHIGSNLLGGEGVEVGVVVGVAHDLMPCVGKGLHGLRVFVHPLAYHEECGFDAVTVQDVDEGLSVFVPPG